MIRGVTWCEESFDSGTLDGKRLAVFNAMLAWIRVALVNAIGEGGIVRNEVGYTARVIAVPVCEQDVRNMEISFL